MGLSGFNRFRREQVERQNAQREADRKNFALAIAESGIGETLAGRLYEAGYRSREDVAAAPQSQLLEIEGIGDERAVALTEWARGGSKPAEKEPEEPNFEEMSLAEIDQFAKENFPDLKMKGNKAEKIELLRDAWKERGNG